MLKLIILLIGNMTLAAYAAAPSTYYQVKTALEKNSKRDLIRIVNELVKAGSPSRMVGKPGHEAAKNFIVESIKSYDKKESGKLTLQAFTPDVEEAGKFYHRDLHEKFKDQSKNSPEYLKWSRFVGALTKKLDQLKDVKGTNLIWEKQGIAPNKVLVITAHYDTISLDTKNLSIPDDQAMPGANYNASGVSVALALIKVLAEIDLNYSVRVAFLDWQGLGYLGSYDYARELKKWSGEGKEILGVMNLEMLGQDTSYLDKAKKTGNMALYLRSDSEEEKWAKKLVELGSKVESKVDFEIKPNNFDQSDTFRFWEQGLKAVTFSQNWEDDFNPKFYQTAQDTPETLNHDTLYGAYRFVGGAALGTLLDITR